MREAALRLVELGAAARWRGADPYDGLWTRWPRLLAGGRRRRQAIVQLHARSPLDIRRLYRRRHSLVPKAPALLGRAAVRLWRAEGDPRCRALAEDALGTLAADATCGDEAWGYPWDTQTRWSHYPGGSPNDVATAFSAAALAEASDALDRPGWRRRAERAAAWVARELYLPGERCFAYHERSERLIHNASLLGAALVHALAPDEPGAAEAVRAATARTLDAQRDDGTWPYGEGPGLGWVDSFHTGYVLDSLRRLEGVDPRIPAAIERGTAAYLAFFDADGRARLWRGRRHPEDSHSAGTGLAVLSSLAERDLVPRATVAAIARRTLTRMIDRSGHAVFRRGRLGPTRVHYPRWCDAPVALGLATAASALDERADPLAPSADPAPSHRESPAG
jgi:hypothetical protein